MGQITSSVGLISGIPTADLINQLLAIESRPKTFIQKRNAILTSQQVAFQEINAKLLSLKLAVGDVANVNNFRTTSVTSSNTNVLTATSKSTSVPGTYDFIVDRVVTTQQMITGGFADADITPVAPAGGTLTFEFGDGRLDSNTNLDRLNGGQGVNRGKIRVTDRSGASAIIDLSTALTTNDVLDKINNNTSVSITATAKGDGFSLADNTGQTLSNLSVVDVGTTGTATSLGLVGNVASSTLTGTQVNTIGRSTLLADLNDGNGVRFSTGTADLQITLRDASTVAVNLTAATNLGDVIDAINTATGANATAGINASGTGLSIVDNTAGATTTAVTALNGSKLASDLGILTTDINNDGTLDGERIIANINSKLLSSLNGGNGVGQSFALGASVLRTTTPLADIFNGAGLTTSGNAANDIRIFSRDNPAASYQIDVDALTTVQDLITAFSTTTGGRVTLAIQGNQLLATDTTGGPSNLIISDINTSTLVADLGLVVNAPVNTALSVGTNPKRDVTASFGPGQIQITNQAGTLTEVDLTTARSTDDIVNLINAAGAGVSVALNSAGNGYAITDTSGGTGSLTIADVGGTVAADLKIAGTFTNGSAQSGNLQIQYISENTALDSIRGGKGFTRGQFIITDSSGATATVDLTQGNEKTFADVISEINSRGLQVTAQINANGDGLTIIDNGPGVVAVSIVEKGSTTAADLGLLGAATAPGNNLVGGFEKTVDLLATDTLNDVITKITDAGIDVKASVINDGSANNPFRLNILASESGKGGAFVFDDGGLGFNASTLVEAQNAAVFFGSTDPAKGIAIVSAKNTLENIVPGATIDLTGTSKNPVRVTISRDNQAVADRISSMVTKFNDVVSSLNKYDKYNADTKQRGLLLGDNTVASVRNSLFKLINARNTDVTGQYTSLSQVGITVGAGAKLSFDSAKFLSAFTTDSQSVETLFTLRKTGVDAKGATIVTASGFGTKFGDILTRLTDGINGTIQTRVNGLTSQIKLNKDRITSLTKLLASKRARLEFQFLSMEKALAQMQSQSSALATLQTLAAPGG